MVCEPGWLTVAIGCSVTLSSRTYSPDKPFGSTRIRNDTGGATPGNDTDGVTPASARSKSISTSTAVPRIPMVAVGVSTFMSPCLAVAPATKRNGPRTRVSSEELFEPVGS